MKATSRRFKDMGLSQKELFAEVRKLRQEIHRDLWPEFY
jgi:hypothetical protein